MKKLILQNFLSPGDIIMLTAAVRDLHLCYPGRFLTDVRTSCDELWEHNPYLTPLDETEAGVEVIECQYPLIDRCNEAPYHCLHGFVEFLNDRLGLQIMPTAFQGDIHLSKQEKAWMSQVQELAGRDLPYWIVVAGGKYDFTIKWWSTSRYQQVVDHFRGRIQFVQVGELGHHHPPLSGVIDLRGQTDLRQLVRLVYHSQGVLCPVTAVMHLAAAVESAPGRSPDRPCVVIAGGREPTHWESYPHHQFIHTIGALPCCLQGGCWRSRTAPLGDGEEADEPETCCVDVVGDLPKCMDMISAKDVVARIETYFRGGAVRYLSSSEARAAIRAVAASANHWFDDAPLNIHSAKLASEAFIRRIPPYPGSFHDRGIVICAGGFKYFVNAWVCIRRLRQVGCKLPIQLWHLGEEELDAAMASLVAESGVECVDAMDVQIRHPIRTLGGWELKPYAILHSRFKQVLLLDADNVPVLNPEFLFETPQFRKTGAVFWRDFPGYNPSPKVWNLCGIAVPDNLGFETGQILVDKEKCWDALSLAMWYNEHSDFYYEHILGDKETFHLAFKKLNKSFAMPAKGIQPLPGTMCQHDFDGRRIFQHRNTDKWRLYHRNPPSHGFYHEKECRACLDDLRQRWDGRMQFYHPGGFLRRLRRHEKISIAAYMISCRERDGLRAKTLRNLALSDWSEEGVWVQMDRACFADRRDRICDTARLALKRALRGKADYVLLLEDDLEFNRFIRENLYRWRPVLEGTITLAGLYNQDLTVVAYDAKSNLVLVDPESVFGSQAFLISRPTVKHLLAHWEEVVDPLDIRIARLGAYLSEQFIYHTPSLVQHIGRKSVWGGRFSQAIDYDPLWKAEPLREASHNAQVSHG